MSKILVIEDDVSILKGLVYNLTKEGFEVVTSGDGEEGLKLAIDFKPDLILLDIMLPSLSGTELCIKLRKKGMSIPIIMLTAKSDESDKVLGLELGADDYVTKPFSIRELKARINSLLRRNIQADKKRNIVEFGKIKINFSEYSAYKENIPINMSAKEFEILKYFVENKGKLITREMLLNEVWGYDVYPTARTVDNYIATIRKKIEDNIKQPKHLITIHTVGYKMMI